jgi:beta-lactamase regulating signal transducer with metallopeptidase domain
MMAPTALQATTSLLAHLTDSVVRSLCLGAAAGFGLFALRVKATSARLFTWTAVLYAALAVPFLAWMLPPLPIPTPAFLRSGPAQSAGIEIQNGQSARARFSSVKENVATARNQVGEEKSRGESPSSSRPSMSSGVSQPPHTTPHMSVVARLASSLPASIQSSTVAAAIYFSVASLLLARLLVGFVFTHRLVKSSLSIRELRVTRVLTSHASACRLRFVPQAAESEVISVPVTVGALHSTILLPAAWREWDDAKLDAVVAHEVSHVARRDALTQRVSLLHRAIFWFSPLAWWLNRQLADLAEQASDEAVLSCGADRSDYARILLEFFETLQAAPGRVWWQGVAMAKAGQAEQRVERILEWKHAGGNIAMGLKKSAVIMFATLAVPAVYIAASANPVNHQISVAQSAAPPPAVQPVAPMVPPVPATAATQSIQPIPPVAPAAAAPSSGFAGRAWPAPPAEQSHSYSYRNDDESRFVIVTGNSDSLIMSGTTEDAHHAQKLRKQIAGDFIWFERDEKSYIIRDQDTIARAHKLWAPQEELGKKQEALGKQQAELGKQQAALGEKQRQVQVKVPDMTAEVDKLKAELKQLSSGATQEQIGQVQSQVGELQSRIGELQSQAGEQQSKLGEQQSRLGEQQSKLGEQQSELGHQQSELSEQASRQMRELLDEAIKNGIAKPESGTGAASL